MSQEYQEDRRKQQQEVDSDQRENSYEYRSERKSSFISLTWKEIMAATLSFLIIGAVGFVFSNFNNRLINVERVSSKNDQEVKSINLLMEVELRDAIGDLTSELENHSDSLILYSNNQRSIERTISRLEAIIERLE